MANEKRVILGAAKTTSGGSDEYGLWVSKPGVDVVNGSGVLANPEDMLIDSRRAEIVSQPLEAGTSTITFNNDSDINSDTGFINFSKTYDYVPILIYSWVDSNTNTVYPMYYEQNWRSYADVFTPTQFTASSQGYMGQSHADIYKDKIKIYCRRFRGRNYSTFPYAMTTWGFSNGTHTLHWAIFGVGEAAVS